MTQKGQLVVLMLPALSLKLRLYYNVVEKNRCSNVFIPFQGPIPQLSQAIVLSWSCLRMPTLNLLLPLLNQAG
jgi:hypothetical protein